ncbi:MAG: HIT family protein [Candidatus Dojkabacteria bacterium]|jgi:histidine triad (HIT) family protein
MKDCIFCKIISGEVDCYKVYEDDDVYAFLDVNPLSKGHTLVVPKKHFENIFDIPDDLLCKVHAVAKKIADNIKSGLNPEGVIIQQNSGRKAGQSVFHFHVHVKPVYKDTVVACDSVHRCKQSDDEMAEVCKVIGGV